MEKLNRILAKHYMVFYIAGVVLLMAWYCWSLETLGSGVGTLVLLFCFVAIAGYAAWLGSRYVVLLKKPIQILDTECDPEPFLEEVQRQRAYSGPWNMKSMRIILEASALCIVGRATEAYQLLGPIQQRIMESKQFALQLNYCGQMVGTCRVLERAHEVEVWHAKYMECYNKIKNKRLKAKFDEALPLYLAQYYVFRREYDNAMVYIAQLKPKNLYEQVMIAVLCARAYLLVGEKERAKEALRFAADKGNKTYAVQIARQMLVEMD